MRQITSKEAGSIERGNLRAVPLRFRPRAQPVYNREDSATVHERKVQRAQRQERLKASIKRAVAAGLGFFKKRGVAQKGQ